MGLVRTERHGRFFENNPELWTACNNFRIIFRKLGITRSTALYLREQNNPELESVITELRTILPNYGVTQRRLSEILDLPYSFFSAKKEPKPPRTSLRVGEKRKNKAGYIEVFTGKGAPGAHESGWIFEHRKVMSEHLGRPLEVWEVIHHKNRIKDDNRIENLEVLTSAEHPTCLKCPYYTELQELKKNHN